MNPLTQLFITAIVAIAVTDAVVFYVIRQRQEKMTVLLVFLLIGITLLPIAIKYFTLV